MSFYIFTFLIQILATLCATAGAVLLFIYFFIDHNNKQYKKKGLLLMITGFSVCLLVFGLEMLLAF